ncbi:winged helix-turn-helix domain-containing protein [Pseudogemmobacter humi]|uniref:Molybdenum-pterin-binding protein MopA n=1 Tax=Pseudogemmobacter humi TaxID=2483812 RepID=A0A3P5X7J0_9RHOB|nr:LysR family transcriptional regulator [Pseudogemmobacter humi]VDC24349.1 Molybdenum-pterin-binding protein MopA [Pseudogemmobacter humi]
MKRFFLRLYFDNAMVGPGKAELMEHIRTTGSISAAGRAMGMSYKRAWMLVEELNAAFAAPLVASARGGAGGGGAHLTPEGEEVLRLFRTIEARARAAGADEIARLEAMLRPAAGDVSPEK